MARQKPPAPTVSSADDVEHEFYESLQQGDLPRLMALWSDDDEIVCVHPGGPRLVGAMAIRSSFEAMFAQGHIAAEPEHVRRVETHAVAVHSLVERVRVMTAEGERFAFVVATNVYVRGARGWKLAAHHASPGTTVEIDDVVEAASTLH